MKTSAPKSNRRDFLKKGITGMAGISLIPVWGKSEEKKEEKKGTDKKKIIYRVLGRTGLKLPVISCGSTPNSNVVRAALDMGIRHFDTANGYGGGANESMLGEIFTGKPRDSFIIATKVPALHDNRTGLIKDLVDKQISPEDLRKDFLEKMDASLKRLKLDYVDILYLYDIRNPDNVRYPLIKEILLELKKTGKTKFLGVSTHQNEPAVIRAATEEKIYDVILTAYNFRQPHREEVKQAVAYAAKESLGIVGMKVMAGVYWDRDRKQPIDAKAAMKWVLQDPNIHTIIPGINSYDELETDMSLMEDLSLSPRERAGLKLNEETAGTGLYCAQCARCQEQCPYHLDIPTLMRCYMYAYGYKNPAKAKGILQKKDTDLISCRDCSYCAVSCTMGFDVPAKLKDILRILDIPDEFLV